jgi:hypothetical protein
MTAPHRRKDLADVQETIRYLRLGADFADRLNPYVRETYLLLHSEVQASREQE